jgi:hypothetical protein
VLDICFFDTKYRDRQLSNSQIWKKGSKGVEFRVWE